MNPEYPVYIVSKGRAESRLTSKALERMQVPYHIVIEPQEYDQYAKHIDPQKILVLPFSNLGQGSIPARNWIWEHSISIGAAWHWILDDNIRRFSRIYNNKKIPVLDGTSFKIIEDFVGRYTNIAIAGMQYEKFVTFTQKHKPFILNTRIYSCILLNNSIPYRWRGKYNEDTDLSIRVLKDGWCTFLCCALTAEKITTMTMKGGNTESLYKLGKVDGRLLMAQSLHQQHPDIVKVVWKFGRWQHHVDYRPFKNNRLIPKPGIEIPQYNNDYGLKLIKQDHYDLE